MAVLGALALPGASLAQTGAKSGKIGVLVQLSGIGASYGVGVQHAIEIAKQELKQKGVIDLEVFYEDHQQQPQLAVTAFQKLIDARGVVAVLANSSPVNQAINPIAKSRGVQVYNFNAVSPALRKLGPWLINGSPLADDDGAVLAKHMINLGFKSAAVLSENDEFGVSVSDAFISAYKAAGGNIVAHEVNNVGNIDMRTQLYKIKSARPDSLVVFCNIPENGYAFVQAQEIGLEAAYFANQFIINPENFKVGGAALNGVRGVAPKFDPNAPNAQEFSAKFTKAAGRPPAASDALAYDGARLVGEAIAAVGNDSKAVGQYIVKVKDWPGAVGNYNFDSDGVAKLPFSFFTLKDGKAIYE
jgi:branched-chain amino acid transport system substrate-binding protein